MFLKSVLTKNLSLKPMDLFSSGKSSILPSGESNPGLPRDRRGYFPQYYPRADFHFNTTLICLIRCTGKEGYIM